MSLITNARALRPNLWNRAMARSSSRPLLACVAAALALAGCGTSIDTSTIGDDLDAGGDDASATDGAPPGDTGGGAEEASDTALSGDTGLATDSASCVAPSKVCAGTCVDTSSDSANCGDCGVSCGSGTTCTSGACKCAGSGVTCGGACVDLSSDPANCGGCGAPCASGASCVSGACACPSDKPATCGGACVDTLTDVTNCGGCGKKCGAGTTCTGGVCACGAGLVKCGGVCKDLSSDPTACGGCGTRCASGAACVSGACSCPTGRPDVCGGVCVDLMGDTANCGGCGVKCLGGACTAGVCACPGGATRCPSGACANLTTDPKNCGACGVVCATGATCTTGAFGTACKCGVGQIVCGPKCVDPSVDPTNCGGCGISCGSGSCVSGACSCGALTKCGAGCADTTSDPLNCGGCGISCGGAACVASKCTTPKCKSAPPSVLFYGALGSVEEPELPAGSTATIADDATWRAMTTADFAKFDLIIIGAAGDPFGGSGTPTSASLLAAFDTRATWAAAVNGRIEVLGLDPGFHSVRGNAGATTFLKASLQWLSTSAPKTTSLYVNSDWGVRKLDFLSPFGALSSSASNYNIVAVTSPTHGTMTGSNSASLSGWGASGHSMVTFPASFTEVASGTSTSGGSDLIGAAVVVRDSALLCAP